MPIKSESTTGLRVLVVEDEALIAEEIQDRLMRLEYRVIGIRDAAKEAIQAAEELHPDLVLMDIRLKGKMDGIEAATHIYQKLEIPVVYLTAYSDEATLERAKATAPFGYVLKPFQERDLLVAIEMASHRHKLVQRLKASELKYATTLASIADGVIATDTDGHVTFMNPVAEALTGWRFAEAEGLPIDQVFQVVDEASRTPSENPIRKALAQKGVVARANPFLLIDRSGSAIPIDDSAAIIRGPKGRMSGAVLAFRDIRHRRLAEDALRRAEEQLRRAQKLEAVGQLAGGVAHDFNNLLAVINGYSDVLLGNDNLNEAVKLPIRVISNAGKQAAALTHQLLALSRKQVLQPVLVDLNHLVSELKEMLGRSIGEHINLTTALSTASVLVKADPAQIEQIILNLAVNARDAMAQGGELTIQTSIVDVDKAMMEARPEMKPGRYALLAITDSGTGMDEATMAHVFEPFFTTKEAGKATGMGLATAYGIVKQSGGYIFANSGRGHGTTFRIYLPAAVDVDASGQDPRSVQSDFHGSETILLAEDEDALRPILSLDLQELGYTVLAAANGDEAIQFFEQHPGQIDLLLTDVVMPNMSGRQLAERIAELKPTIRVLYMSGYTDDIVIRHGVLKGETAFLQKPFTATTLARKLREVLDQSA